MLMGHSLNVSSFVIILVLVLGVVGMFLSVPIMVLIRIVCANVPSRTTDVRWHAQEVLEPVICNPTDMSQRSVTAKLAMVLLGLGVLGRRHPPCKSSKQCPRCALRASRQFAGGTRATINRMLPSLSRCRKRTVRSRPVRLSARHAPSSLAVLTRIALGRLTIAAMSGR
jgi:hypothetical protein